jgi:hypothetical protein
MDYWKKRIVTMLVLSVLSGCGSLHRTPAWVNNPQSVYPENEYLVAVGEGDTRHAAENIAEANLARIFEAHIESDERLIDQVHETNTSFQRATEFTTDINILSSQTLHNIQHAESWRDNRGRVHAVAYLNRRDTAEIYRNKIANQTAGIQFLLAQAEQTGDLIKQYAILRESSRQALKNERLLQQLKIIHPPSAAGSLPYSEDHLRKNLADTAQQIRVKINLTGDTNGRMTAVIEDLITRYGFVGGTPSLLNIEGRISITDTGQRTADLVFVRYELVLQIKDAQNSVLFTLNEKGREGHVSLSEARNRSFRTLENKIKSTGSKRLDVYFDSLIDQTPQ